MSLATTYHTKIGKVLLIVLVQLHRRHLVLPLAQGENLVKPMVTGDKDLEFETPASTADHGRSRLLALVVMDGVRAVVAALVMGSA